VAESMTITFERSGGVAGITLRAIIDVDALATAEKDELMRAMEKANVSQLPRRAGPPPVGADRFVYVLEISDAGRVQHIEIGEPLPEGLRDLVNHLVRLARAQRRAQPGK